MAYSAETQDSTNSAASLTQSFGGISKGASDNQIMVIGVVVVVAFLAFFKKGR